MLPTEPPDFCKCTPIPVLSFASFVTFACILTTLSLCLCHVYFCPQPVSSSMPQSRVTASVPENLSLFLDPAPKAEEGTVKKLSKDSILSLYASTPSVHASSMATHGEN